MRPGHYRTYSSIDGDFWCCTGTGMENQAKYGEFIYGYGADRLYVNLLVPSTLTWAGHGLIVRQTTRFPEDGRTTLTIEARQAVRLAVAVRYPGWLAPGRMRLAVNGTEESVTARPGEYALLDRTWKSGDRIEVEWPLAIRTERLPHSRDWVSVLYGPVVLAGRLGTEGLDGFDFDNSHDPTAQRVLSLSKAPVIVAAEAYIAARIKPIVDRPLTFRSERLCRPADVTLAPFYAVHHERYAVYWRMMTVEAYETERRRVVADHRIQQGKPAAGGAPLPAPQK